MDSTAIVLENALLSGTGILGMALGLGALVGFLLKREAGQNVRMGFLIGVLVGIGLVAFSVIQTRNTLDASMPNQSQLQPPQVVAQA